MRLIFTRYLELAGVNQLVVDLKERGLRSKVRRLSTGASRGGVPFTQGPLFYMLRNRFYLGEVNFKGEILPGPQPALLERSLFEAVQDKLTAQWQHRNRIKQKSQTMLSGLVFDDAGRPMVVTHAVKNRVRYRYYISAPLQRGLSNETVGSVSRVPAQDIEAAVTKALHRHLKEQSGSQISEPDRDGVRDHVSRVDVRTTKLALHLKEIGSANVSQEVDQNTNFEPEFSHSGETIIVDWMKPPMRRFREVMQPASAAPSARVRPIRAERRAGLIKAIARGRLWLDEIVAGTASFEDLAARHKCSARQINLKVSMAFLAPALVKAAIEGCLPWGVGIAQLRSAPSEWSGQFEHIGLPPPFSRKSDVPDRAR